MHHWLVGALTLGLATAGSAAAGEVEETNKALARRFYEEVWFSRNLDAVQELVAPEYVVHDTGERKAATEPRSEQREIADFFWQTGTMTGRIDYQIAEGDLVATRWQWDYRPSDWLMKASMFGARHPIPIINVFRFQDGKIVEIWNHRHDVDTNLDTNFAAARGFAAGVVFVLGIGLLRRLWRRWRTSDGASRA